MNPRALYLAQTDTTAGFLSADPEKIARAKGRSAARPLLICVDTLHKQKALVRTPQRFRKRVRRARKSTFIYPNTEAIRVVRDGRHSRFLERFAYLYSSSANKTGEEFDYTYAARRAEIILFEPCGFYQNPPSSIYRIGRRRIKRVR